MKKMFLALSLLFVFIFSGIAFAQYQNYTSHIPEKPYLSVPGLPDYPADISYQDNILFDWIDGFGFADTRYASRT